jgi:amino acid transporter
VTDTLVKSAKRVLLGRPRATREQRHQLLPKWMALPVFSSDPLSSVSYATEEMMLVLSLAGAATFALVMPLSLGVALLIAVVITSYRQTVMAYPTGGGAYIVARENLGDIPGLTAAGALLVDYLLTVSVSIAAGVAAITSALPQLQALRVPMAIGFVLVVMYANLRGLREAGATFAVPTYAFVVVMLIMIGLGLVKCMGGCPPVPPSDLVQPPGHEHLTLFLALHAFSSGSTALTGIEAISNGVPAFRYPHSRNAATTLAMMGAIAITLFLGISFLATHIPGVVAFEGLPRTVTSQIASAVFGAPSLGFYAVQVVTALILILAANTAYQDFPRLSSVLAGDRFLPRQFIARGDRLVFSNGILVLTGLAILLLIAFKADVSKLIQLYVVGVFTSFTFSQAGMVRHWMQAREKGWQRSMVVNAIGAVTTGLVLVIVAATKFMEGAWLVIIAIPLVVLMMHRIHRHYGVVSAELRPDPDNIEQPKPNHMLILAERVDAASSAALSMALRIRPRRLRGVAPSTVGPGLEDSWAELVDEPNVERVDPEEKGSVVEGLTDVVRRETTEHPEAFVTALVPETLSQSWTDVLRSRPLVQRLKARLVGEGLIVTNIVAENIGPGPYEVVEPVEHHVVVLVSSVDKATLRALAYARGLNATSLRALMINLEGDVASEMLSAWDEWDIDIPLEVIDSPFRSASETIRDYVHAFEPERKGTLVSCILPEFVVPHWWHRALHNQTALFIKGVLLFERGVVTTSVPYPLSGNAD